MTPMLLLLAAFTSAQAGPPAIPPDRIPDAPYMDLNCNYLPAPVTATPGAAGTRAT